MKTYEHEKAADSLIGRLRLRPERARNTMDHRTNDPASACSIRRNKRSQDKFRSRDRISQSERAATKAANKGIGNTHPESGTYDRPGEQERHKDQPDSGIAISGKNLIRR